MNAPRIRKWYERERQITRVEGESMTDVSFGNETNINTIVERFTRTGTLPAAEKEGRFADVTGLQKPLDQLIIEHREAIAELEQRAADEAREQRDAMQQENTELREKLDAMNTADVETPPPSS